MNYMEKKIHVGQPEYDTHFWSAMRGNAGSYNKLEVGKVSATGAYLMPGASSTKCMNALGKESLFRQIGTVVKAYGNGYKILAKDCHDLAMWVPESGDIPLRDGMTDFAVNALQSWKLATFIKMDEAFVHDAAFNVEDYLVERLARNFGEAEEQAFINGNFAGDSAATEGSRCGFVDRETILDTCRLMQSTLTDNSGINAECEELLRELDVVAGLIRSCVEENATQSVDQSDYRRRYTSYVERYETLKDRYAQLQTQREEREMEAIRIGGFMFELRELDELPVAFDERLWHGLVDHVTVYHDERLVFHFKDGSEIAEQL